MKVVEATKSMNVEKAGKPIEVLIVEDNPDELQLIQQLLEKARGTSFHINRADRLSTAVKRLARGNIDVVLVDLSLPDSQGPDTCVRIKAQASDVPVIVLSGLEDESLATAVMDGGAQDYLVKGQIDGNLLVHSLHHAIQRRQTEEALRESEQRYRTLFESAAEGILIADSGALKFKYSNPAICTMLGYSQEEFTKMSVGDIHPKTSLEHVLADFATQARGEKTLSPALPCLKKDGTIIYADIKAAKAIIDGRECNVGFFTDVTERKNVEGALAQAAERDSAIAKLASKLVSPTSIEDVSDLVLESAERFTNSTFGFVGYIDPETGYMVSPTMTRGIWESCQIKDKTVIFEKFGGLWGWVLNNRQSLLTNAPADDPRSTGTPLGHIPIRNFLSAPALIVQELVGLVALANSSRSYNEQDLVFIERLATLYAVALQRRRLEDTVSQLAYHDPLTGLPNRTLFKDRSTLAVLRANRYRQKIAFMVLDMDLFKDINDTLGHDAGDNILRDFSNRLVSILRKTDTVSRMGGDEFVLLLPEASDAENIANVAQKILEAIRKPFMFHDREIRITTSIGISIYPEDGEDVDTLIKHADLAMYHVKEKGRNNYQRYARIMSTVTQE